MPSPPVRKVPNPIKVSSLKPPPLPLRKPSQAQSPTPPSPNASVSPHGTSDEVRHDAEASFKAAQAKAKLSGVHTLTQKDIDGLSLEQIERLTSCLGHLIRDKPEEFGLYIYNVLVNTGN